MDSEEQIARERIGRLARQLLRQERSALLHQRTDDAEHARSLLESARTVQLGAIAAYAQRAEDDALRARCDELQALYDALPPSAPDPGALSRAHAALVDLVNALPPSTIARLRVAVRTG